MSNTSWVVTIVPLAVYIIGFTFSLASGEDLSVQQADLLKTLLYGFLGAGTIGAANKVIPKLRK